MQGKLAIQHVLVAFQGLDFRHRDVENMVQPDDLGRALKNELELRFAAAQCTHNELRVKIVANDKADSAIAIRATHNGAIPSIIGRKPGLVDVSQY